MKPTARQYILDVKEIEAQALRTLNDEIVYSLKFKTPNISRLLFSATEQALNRAYKKGVEFGRAIVKKLNELEEKIKPSEIDRYIKRDTGKIRPERYRLTRKAVFNFAVKEIEIEKKRFNALYDLRVSAYEKDGLSRNKARNNIEVTKLENEYINRIRRVVSNLVYLNAQIGQFTALKEKK